MVTGIHHITTISSDPNRTVSFYRDLLGLRLVKQTVNFDSPDTYHLYFGDETGEPGTAMTLFPFVNAGTGMRGIQQSTKIQFAVPKGSLAFWYDRFLSKGVRTEKIEKKFGLSTIRFYDFDGLQLELVMHQDPEHFESWEQPGSGVSREHAIQGFFGVELSVGGKTETEKVLTDILDYEQVASEGNHTRYKSKTGTVSKCLDGHLEFKVQALFTMLHSGWQMTRQN